ncbi:MAG: YggS family pyridoxal phosphate-dependent enzyme [Clostridia bacterium]|nr:YggS family pyridoxal phosphate-dependent enzyme [Clostridia bacterium]MBQ5770600.1 YggS family pyridoxal phosphate-dependent enzyme [Clostridia bacterium]
MSDREDILSRYRTISENVLKASGEWGGCEIMPVTKTVEAERILVLKEAGVARIGENRVQEAMEKLPALKDAFDFHIIGRMQTNKAKYVAKFASCVQSLDRLELAEALQKALVKEDRTLEVFIEINIGKDPAKAGVYKEDAHAFIKALRAYENLKVTGLMTVAPIVEKPEDARGYFREMRMLFDDMRHASGGENLKNLSMGMSKDCLIAAEEGATIVRVGSAIFGARTYPPVK